jgi:hypothetical protein
MCRESALEKWTPIQFDTDVERLYAQHLSARFIPLMRLACAIGIMAFIGYGFWDLLLDPNALGKTVPIRLVAVLHFSVCFGLSFLAPVRTNPRYLPILVLYVYGVYAYSFALILSHLPGGFVAGLGGWIVGMIFIPAVVNGVRQTAGVLVPFLLVTLVTSAFLGATRFELIKAFRVSFESLRIPILVWL